MLKASCSLARTWSTALSGRQKMLTWEERFYYTPPPPGNHLRDCNCARIETKASIHHPLWVVVVVVYKIVLPMTSIVSTTPMDTSTMRCPAKASMPRYT